MSLVAIGVAVLGAAAATVVGRATGAGWPAALGLAALLGGGLYLFARDDDKGWGDLGEGIMVSVVVAIALLAVQRDADERTREATERRDEQLHDADVRRDRQLRDAEARRQQAADRQNLQLTLTMQSDLTGIALANRDLRGFFLAGKNLNQADLEGANLRGADLRKASLRQANLLRADLKGATLARANLQGAILSPYSAGADQFDFSTADTAASLQLANLERADLRSANLIGVDLSQAFLAEADLSFSLAFGSDDLAGLFRKPRGFNRSILIFADFSAAKLDGADFRGAKLGGATFCFATGLRRAKFDGAVYDAKTRWPPRFNPTTRGAKKLRGTRARQFDFKGVSGGIGTRSVPLSPHSKRFFFPPCL